jgi:hypothetical protein
VTVGSWKRLEQVGCGTELFGSLQDISSAVPE